MITVIYSGNSKMFDGVLLSVLSMARRTKETLNIKLLSMDLTSIKATFTPFNEKQASFIDNYLKKYNKDNTFELIDCTDLYNQYLAHNKNESSHYSPYAVLRLLLNHIPGMPEKLIYLDCDTMVYGDIKELYDINIEGYEYAAVHDYMGKFWISKNYINSGVLLLNLKECKKTKLLERSIEMVNKKKMEFPDQKPLNILVKSRLFLPARFNEQREVKSDTIVKHFVRGIRYFPFFYIYNIKQWDIEKVHSFLKIHEFDEDYDEYTSIKSKLDAKIQKEYEEKNKKYIIQVTNLRKSYGDVHAVDGITFNVKRGSLFAFLGENGAGKSTTINIIASILYKDSGKVFIDGCDLDHESNSIKKEIGIVFQNSVLDDVLTVEENLAIRASFYNLKKEDVAKNLSEIESILNLKPLIKRQVKKLSGGQRRRVDIARSLIHFPKILILDEPTTGLDPKTREIVWSLIAKIRKEIGTTVFLTTHYLEEADQATDVVIMDHGHIIAQGTPTELKNLYANDYILVYSKNTKELDKLFSSYRCSYLNDQQAYKILVKNADEAQNFLEKFRDVIKDFEVKKGKMDDVFLAVTSEHILEGEEK